MNKVVLELSPMSNSATGYIGSSFSPKWTKNIETPFCAFIQTPKHPELVSLLPGEKARTGVHLGYYSDSREAAYVRALFDNATFSEQRAILISARNNKWHLDVEFPEYIYEEPVFMTTEEAKKQIQDCENKKVKKDSSDKIALAVKDACKRISMVVRNPKIRNGIVSAVEANTEFYNTTSDVVEYAGELMLTWKTAS